MEIKIAILILVFGGVFYLAVLYVPALEALMQRWQEKRMRKVTPRLNEMFLDIPLRKLLILDIASPLIAGAVGFLATRSFMISLAFAAVGLLLPVVVVKGLEAKRRQKFAAQIVDGLLIISSSLKAGLSMMQAFEELVGEMPAPISQEFGLVVRQMQMGVTLDESMLSLKKRMNLDELDMVVTSMLVARETGGDITKTFSRIIYTIQERNKLLGRVRALCTQGVLQGVIMSIMPIVFALFVYKMNPHFFDVFFKNSMGKALLVYAGISQVVGMFLIRKFSMIKV